MNQMKLVNGDVALATLTAFYNLLSVPMGSKLLIFEKSFFFFFPVCSYTNLIGRYYILNIFS